MTLRSQEIHRMVRPIVLSVLALSTHAAAAPAVNPAQEESRTHCAGLPSHAQLQEALGKAVAETNGGIFKPNMMWASIVNARGAICAIARVGDAWPGSRIISAQKAFTAMSFSNSKLALSTANLYSAVQPGGSLFGLQHSLPINPALAYRGDARLFGTDRDPLVGRTLGGLNVFGGGLPLYGKDGQIVGGGLGASGDSACADHIIAWRVRASLGLNNVPAGVSATKDDNIIHDLNAAGKSAGGFGHPECSPEATEIAGSLPKNG